MRNTSPDPRRARERLVVKAGATIVVVALLLTYVALPAARRWREREAAIARTTEELRALTALVDGRRALDSAATDAERSLAIAGRRVIRARSLALAASTLQSLLQDAADASRLVVTRLDVAPGDVAGFADTSAAAGRDGASVPATLSAYCDIHGLAALLRHLETGPRAVAVERMTVQINPALRGAPDVLQVSLTLRAPVVLTEGEGAP